LNVTITSYNKIIFVEKPTIMKKIYLRSFMVLVLSTMIISCSKEESATTDSIKESSINQASSKQIYAVLPPYNVGEEGKDSNGKVKQPRQPDWNTTLPNYAFSFIDKPTTEYTKETCLIDISGLEYNKDYHKLQNGTLTIGFFDVISDKPTRLLKLKSSNATGWNANWGISPYVEQGTPDVLFYSGSRAEKLVISLSKPCVEFGFEIAANHQNSDHLFELLAGDYTYDGSKGNVVQTTKGPGGAKLIMVRSTKPFTTVTFGSADSPTGVTDIQGLAIANIRYKLAK